MKGERYNGWHESFQFSTGEIFMVIALPPELERLVQRQVESGKYETAIEALLAGMNLLDQQN